MSSLSSSDLLTSFHSTYFYRKTEVAKRVGLFISAGALAGAFGGLISFGVSSLKNPVLPQWRILFLVSCVPFRSEQEFPALPILILDYRLDRRMSLSPRSPRRFLLPSLPSRFDSIPNRRRTTPLHYPSQQRFSRRRPHRNRLESRQIRFLRLEALRYCCYVFLYEFGIGKCWWIFTDDY